MFQKTSKFIEIHRIAAENEAVEVDEVLLTVGSESIWGCLKIHVDLFKNEKTKKYEFSKHKQLSKTVQ